MNNNNTKDQSSMLATRYKKLSKTDPKTMTSTIPSTIPSSVIPLMIPEKEDLTKKLQKIKDSLHDTIQTIDQCNKDVDILNTELTIYNYTTTDGSPGTIIVNSNDTTNPKLRILFDENKLFIMENVTERKITLRDILEQGIVSIGSTDIMESLTICYPDSRISNKKPSVKGLYMHGSRKRLIAETLNTEFDYDPESDHEQVDFDSASVSDSDDTTKTTTKTNKIDVDWLTT